MVQKLWNYYRCWTFVGQGKLNGNEDLIQHKISGKLSLNTSDL